MAQIVLPHQGVTQAPEPAPGSPLYERRRLSNAGSVELLPNPDFVFPQREATPASRPVSLQPLPAGRRGSAAKPRQQSVNALPDFSFHPSGQSASPPASPLAPPTPKTMGHRRRGSEFIGGDGRPGHTSSVLSSSPTKGDGLLPAPNSSLHPPTGRRGHAHRRSGAISSHDLSSIMRPDGIVPSKPESAPTTPLESGPFFGHVVNKSVSQPSLHAAIHDDAISAGTQTSQRRPSSRARVEFSDKVEYIRPLSTISSGTESSLSTIRGHSKSGSLSSIASPGAPSPPSARAARPSFHPSLEEERRPSTAGAVLDKLYGSAARDASKRASSAPSSSSNPSTADSPLPASGRRRGFFRLDPRCSDPRLPAPLSGCASDPAMPHFDSPLPSPTKDMDASEPEAKSQQKSSHTPRKVKSWATSIIAKKDKYQSKLKNRPPTPPPANPLPADDDGSEADFTANFDVDNTVTIVTPTTAVDPVPNADMDMPAWRPQPLKRQNSDAMSPVIDLDAALGPFNTPNGASPRTRQRSFAAHRRAMHSAGLVQHHRRTESAPELIPFDGRTGSVGSTSTMDDVFEEEEEEEPAVSAKPGAAVVVPEEIKEETEELELSTDVKVVESDDGPAGSGMNWDFSGLGISSGQPAHGSPYDECVSPQTQVSPPLASAELSASDAVHVVQDEEPRTSSLTRSSDSTVTPTMDRDAAKQAQPVMNLSIPLPQPPLLTPDTLTASSISSPDFHSSQASFDMPRLGTAASSLTDYRTLPSPQFGEPGPEVRISVDDVPSLTSSRSTMTGALHNAIPFARTRGPGDRSTSLCSAPGDMNHARRKRSSIASLSRLINGSSFGEKSKLSIEQRPQSEHMEPAKDAKHKKHKRLSKLMHFWKPKDATNPKANAHV